MHFVQIDIEGDVITIGMDDKSMEQHREKARHLAEGGDKSVTLHRVERSTLFKNRALRLPENAETSKIGASYENGVLYVTIPKKTEVEKTKRITIA
jgi:HSP20 family molecular chaperone IbpA